MRLPTLSTCRQSLDPLRSPYWADMITDPVSFQKGTEVRALFLVPQGIAAVSGTHRVLPGAYRYMLATSQNLVYRETLDPRSFSTIAAEIISHTEKDPSWMDAFFAEFSFHTERLISLTHAVERGQMPSDPLQLKCCFADLIDTAMAAQSYGYLTEVYGDHAWVSAYLKEQYPTIDEEDAAILLEPVTPSFISRYHKRLYSAHDAGDLERIITDYFWIKCSYVSIPTLTLDALEAEKEGLSDETKDFERLINQKGEILQKAPAQDALRNFIRVAEVSIAMQDERKANVLRLNYALYHLLARACQTYTEWNADELLSCSPHEALRFFREGLPISFKEVLRKRDQKSAWVFLDEGYELSTDPAVVDPIFTVLHSSGDDLVRGNTAYGGTVVGTVKVVLSEKDFSKVNEGDILVSWMTRPEYLPIIKKAGGIITNEGGITCHAAIIARELKKPCVIGTKHATQVLQDGDRIEMDGNAGTVKVLSKGG